MDQRQGAERHSWASARVVSTPVNGEIQPLICFWHSIIGEGFGVDASRLESESISETQAEAGRTKGSWISWWVLQRASGQSFTTLASDSDACG